ncbi:hypothetical protein I4U23_020207 [Adineta vaga]|nr:hypothetical protein I4U23_020207 [Adineta vaga]
MSSSSNTNSTGFGITLHHEGQNAENSLVPSPSGGTGDRNKQDAGQGNDQQNTKKQDVISEHDIKNNRP